MEVILLWLIGILINALAVYITAAILPKVSISSYGTAIGVALILATIGALLKWILVILTLPLIALTLGLFYFVIYALVLKMADAILDGFRIEGFLMACVMAVVLTIINLLLFGIIPGL